MVESQQGLLVLLGGSSFMGLTFLRSLAKSTKIKVVVINRGNKYWDGESQKLIESNQFISHLKADRKKSDQFIKIVYEDLLAKTEDGTKVEHFVDFSCFKPKECSDIFQILDMLREKGRLVTSRSLRYCFISTDSTYDASCMLLDSHKHKLYHPDKQKIENKLKLPKNDQRCMYR